MGKDDLAKRHRFSIARIACLCFAAAAMPATASAGGGPDQPGIVTLQVENDLFGSGADRHYTQGMRASWLPPDEMIPDWVRDGAMLVPGIDAADRFTFVFSIGQNMYTPAEIEAETPDPTDRPYAGWLYVSVGAVAEDAERNLLHNVALDLGVVGPWSLADQTQTWWHDLIDTRTPRGWDHQLRNEPGIVLTYEARLRESIATTAFGLEIDATPKAGVALGNVFTHAALGAALRIGHNLSLDYGPPIIRPSLPGAGLVKRRGEFGWYLFAGVEGRAVARNIFLDGNTFGEGPSVGRKPFIGDLQAGLVLTLGSVNLAFTQILRSEEFDGQQGFDHYGAASLTFLY